MSKKQGFLTHMFANCSMTLLSLATMLGLGFSSIKLFTFMNHNIALITNVNWTNALILNCILDGVMMLVFSVGLIIQLIDGNCEEQIQAILKIVSILSIAIFMISSYFSCSSFGDSMTLLYNLLISCLGVAFGIAAIASIGLAFMHKKVINKISYWKNRLSNFLQAKKEKQEKIKNSKYLKESTFKTEEQVAKSKVDEIQSMFNRVKSHLSIDKVYFKTDTQMNEHIQKLEKTISSIMKNSKNEAYLADIKSLMFKSLPEIALAYKDIANEGSFNQQTEHKQLVLNTLKDINQYFDNILEKSQEEAMIEKTNDLSIKLEFAKKRFLTNTQAS